MFIIEDDSVFDEFEYEELEKPSPRKEVDGQVIHVSRRLGMPARLGAPVLCHLGTAISGENENNKDVQPNVYRATEVILGIPWSYKIDIWNSGCGKTDISNLKACSLTSLSPGVGYLRRPVHILWERSGASNLSQPCAYCWYHLGSRPSATQSRCTRQRQ